MSNLETELMGAGFIPVPLGIEGVTAWTGWRSPAADAYERYYEHIRLAMIAQVDRKAETGLLGIGQPQTIVRSMDREFHAVVDCWRSAASIAPQ